MQTGLEGASTEALQFIRGNLKGAVVRGVREHLEGELSDSDREMLRFRTELVEVFDAELLRRGVDTPPPIWE